MRKIPHSLWLMLLTCDAFSRLSATAKQAENVTDHFHVALLKLRRRLSRWDRVLLRIGF